MDAALWESLAGDEVWVKRGWVIAEGDGGVKGHTKSREFSFQMMGAA